MDAGSDNWNERERNLQLGMGRQRRMDKKKRIKTLGTERCANIVTLHINQYAYIKINR